MPGYNLTFYLKKDYNFILNFAHRNIFAFYFLNFRMGKNEILTSQQKDALINTLKSRFEKNKHRHKNIEWNRLQAKLDISTDKLWSLYQMEESGGEPDVASYNEKSDTYTFFDFSAEAPKGRRSICYDRDALESRKEHKPANNAVDMASAMGIDILTEEQYRALQQVKTVDTKTSSWIMTPPEIRELGGAIFADFRYGQVFIHHNGAPSYYASRAFRGAFVI